MEYQGVFERGVNTVASVTLTAEDILHMANTLHLPIPAERLEQVAQNTEAWYNNANKLAEKMMAEQYREQIPLAVVRFSD